MSYTKKVKEYTPKQVVDLHVFSYDGKFPTGKAIVLADITRPKQFSLLEKCEGLPAGTFRRCLVTPIDYTAVLQLRELFDGETNLHCTEQELLDLQLIAADLVVEHLDTSGAESHQRKILLDAINQPQVYAWTIKV